MTLHGVFTPSRCGSTRVLRSSLTLTLHLKTWPLPPEWRWCLRPWSGVWSLCESMCVWGRDGVSVIQWLTTELSPIASFPFPPTQRYDGWGRKSIRGLLPAQRGDHPQAQERRGRGAGLHARRAVSANVGFLSHHGRLQWLDPSRADAHVFCVPGTTTRSPGSTTGTSRTKPARAMRRTTSSSSETETVFTITSLRRGNLECTPSKNVMQEKLTVTFIDRDHISSEWRSQRAPPR